jgi:hypothetical protein
MSSVVDKAVSAFSSKDVKLAAYWAELYRSHGYNPLPSRSDAKRPFVRYAEYWEKAYPAEEFDRFEPTNIQVMCGVHWNLVVLDVDGPAAMDWLKRTRKYMPPTWTVSNNDNGFHSWYRLPADWSGPLDSCVIYDGEGKHSEVARKADRSLIVAPPSHHVERKSRYQWHGERWNPANGRPPAVAPDWLLRFTPAKVERPVPVIASPHFNPIRYTGPGRYAWEEVANAIPDKLSLAQYYGLRVPSRIPTNSDWIPVYRDDTDRTPSATFNRVTGFTILRGGGGEQRLTFFQLLVYLGAFCSVRDAINSLGQRFVR